MTQPAPHILPPLPYRESELEPYISKQTVDLHYGKHHQAYITNLNNLLKGNPLEGKPLEEVVKAAHGKPDLVGIFNNGGQAWNHNIYWPSLKPKGGGGKPTGALAEKINSDLGGYDKFQELFKAAATSQFGSGWAWLMINKDKKLEVIKTTNAESPLVKGGHALLGLDVWEHAYYLDYQNRRPDYVQAFLDHLLNWDFANQQLQKA